MKRIINIYIVAFLSFFLFATVSLAQEYEAQAVNIKPVFEPWSSVELVGDEVKEITISATDLDGDPLTLDFSDPGNTNIYELDDPVQVGNTISQVVRLIRVGTAPTLLSCVVRDDKLGVSVIRIPITNVLVHQDNPPYFDPESQELTHVSGAVNTNIVIPTLYFRDEDWDNVDVNVSGIPFLKDIGSGSEPGLGYVNITLKPGEYDGGNYYITIDATSGIEGHKSQAVVIAQITGGSIPPACFIATAAYNSSYSKEVNILRKFRDQHLMKNKFGRKFVKAYYKYSPPIANYISNKPMLKSIVRAMLKPLVFFSKTITK